MSGISGNMREQLLQIGGMAWGSGTLEKSNGGRGLMGLLNGRLVKCYTHGDESAELGRVMGQKDSYAYTRLQTASDALRAQLLQIAFASDRGGDDKFMAKIYKALGIQTSGNPKADVPLLSRKMVADTISLIDKGVWKTLKEDFRQEVDERVYVKSSKGFGTRADDFIADDDLFSSDMAENQPADVGLEKSVSEKTEPEKKPEPEPEKVPEKKPGPETEKAPEKKPESKTETETARQSETGSQKTEGANPQPNVQRPNPPPVQPTTTAQILSSVDEAGPNGKAVLTALLDEKATPEVRQNLSALYNKLDEYKMLHKEASDEVAASRGQNALARQIRASLDAQKMEARKTLNNAVATFAADALRAEAPDAEVKLAAAGLNKGDIDALLDAFRFPTDKRDIAKAFLARMPAAFLDRLREGLTGQPPADAYSCMQVFRLSCEGALGFEANILKAETFDVAPEPVPGRNVRADIQALLAAPGKEAVWNEALFGAGIQDCDKERLLDILDRAPEALYQPFLAGLNDAQEGNRAGIEKVLTCARQLADLKGAPPAPSTAPGMSAEALKKVFSDKSSSHTWAPGQPQTAHGVRFQLTNNTGNGMNCFFFSVLDQLGLVPSIPNAMKLRELVVEHGRQLVTQARSGGVNRRNGLMSRPLAPGIDMFHAPTGDGIRDITSAVEQFAGNARLGGRDNALQNSGVMADVSTAAFLADMLKRPVHVLRAGEGEGLTVFDRDLSTGLQLQGEPIRLYYSGGVTEYGSFGHFQSLRLA